MGLGLGQFFIEFSVFLLALGLLRKWQGLPTYVSPFRATERNKKVVVLLDDRTL